MRVYVVLQPTHYSRNNLRQYAKISFMDSNLFGTYFIWGLFYRRDTIRNSEKSKQNLIPMNQGLSAFTH